VISLEDDTHEGEPLLRSVMRQGRRLAPTPSLAESRARAKENLSKLPVALQRLDAAATYCVDIGAALRALVSEVDRRTEGGASS
jgi:nicotinate phosphoribosyltransferase